MKWLTPQAQVRGDYVTRSSQGQVIADSAMDRLLDAFSRYPEERTALLREEIHFTQVPGKK
jgi:hypothetical protein